MIVMKKVAAEMQNMPHRIITNGAKRTISGAKTHPQLQTITPHNCNVRNIKNIPTIKLLNVDIVHFSVIFNAASLASSGSGVPSGASPSGSKCCRTSANASDSAPSSAASSDSN